MKAKEVEKSFQEIRELFRETARRFKETDEKFKETDKLVRRTQQEVASLTGKWGHFVEGLIIPAVERLFEERGIEVHTVSRNVKTRKNGTHLEIDILAENDEYVILIEAKSTLGVEDVNDHLVACQFSFDTLSAMLNRAKHPISVKFFAPLRMIMC